MNSYNKYIDHTFRLFCCISVATVAILLTINTSHALKTDGFVEVSSEEIKNLVVGNTVIGTYKGTRYEEYYEPNGRLRGNYGSGGYTGRWKILSNNILRLDVDRILNFTLLKNPENGAYYFGEKRKNGKYSTLHKIEILKGDKT